MTPRSREQMAARVDRWLRAEAAEAAGGAEAALTALLAWLPDEAPSEAFTEKVLARVREDSRRATAVGWLLRVAAVMGLVLVGSSIIATPSVLLALPVSVGAMIAALANGVAAFAAWLGHAVSLWEALAAIGRKVALVLATPQATVALLATMSLGAAAFRVLYSLTMQDRRALHVDTL